MRTKRPTWKDALAARERMQKFQRWVDLMRSGSRVAREVERKRPKDLAKKYAECTYRADIRTLESHWDQGFAVGYMLAIEEQNARLKG